MNLEISIVKNGSTAMDWQLENYKASFNSFMFCYQVKYSLCNGFLKVLLIIAAKNTQNRISIVLKIKKC